MRNGRSRSSNVVDFGTNRSNFLLDINTKLDPILHGFWDMATYWLKIAKFFLPHSHLTPLLVVNSSEFLDEFLLSKLESLGYPSVKTRGWLTRGAQLTAGYTVNTYSKSPLYYTLGAVAPFLPCLRMAAVLRTAHTLGHGGPLPHADRHATRDRHDLPTNQPTSQPASRFASTSCKLGILWS